MRRALTPLGPRFIGAAALLLSTAAATSCVISDGSEQDDAPDGPTAVGSCDYTGSFSGLPECRAFVGEGWTEDNVVAECEALQAEPRLGEGCSETYALGTCTLEVAPDALTVIYTYSEDASLCADQLLGCETFGGGSWDPFPVCGEGGGGGGAGGVFIQPTLSCVEPLDGEPPGDGPDGQVCTWQSISGCTEEGRHFADYASCDVVLTQRPYFPGPPAEGWDAPDPRLDDPSYVAELEWVTSQVEASGCVCCHSSELAPNGPSNWYTDAPGNWMNTMNPTGLALGARWVESVALGAYSPEDNNGFERETAGFPSTDPERMRAFFIAELAHRGYSEADFADAPPFGGPLHDQLEYEPGPCTADQRVDADGTIHWTGGSARYVYVLEAGSGNPTVPPNLDLPAGTRWRLDVPADGDPMESGLVRYGEVPQGVTQRFPEQDAPTALTSGTSYYLYVTRDVGIPLTRCLFTAP